MERCIHVICTSNVNRIYAGYERLHRFFRTIIRNNLFGDFIDNALLTLVNGRRHFCVTKEKYEKIYTNGDGHHKISVGDDIEDFVGRVIANQIDKNELGLRLSGGSSGINSFHVALLSHEEKDRLATNDSDYIKTYQPWTMVISRSKPALTKSICGCPQARNGCIGKQTKVRLIKMH